MAYGCFGRKPFRETFQAQDGWTSATLTPDIVPSTRKPQMVTIPFRMSKQCEYSLTELGKADKGCVDCEWKQPT